MVTEIRCSDFLILFDGTIRLTHVQSSRLMVHPRPHASHSPVTLRRSSCGADSEVEISSSTA